MKSNNIVGWFNKENGDFICIGCFESAKNKLSDDEKTRYKLLVEGEEKEREMTCSLCHMRFQ